METVSSICITFLDKNIDDEYEANEYIIGEDTIESIKMSKTASGIEIEVTDEDGTKFRGWPWSSIKEYEFTK